MKGEDGLMLSTPILKRLLLSVFVEVSEPCSGHPGLPLPGAGGRVEAAWDVEVPSPELSEHWRS